MGRERYDEQQAPPPSGEQPTLEQPPAGERAPQKKKQKKKRGFVRRVSVGLLKLVGWTVFVAIIVVLATLHTLRSRAGAGFLRDQVLAATKSVIPGLRVGRISGDYTSNLSVHDVLLADRSGKPVLSLERLTVRFDVTSLLSKRVQVDEVTLVRPRIHLRRLADGSLNVAHLVVPSKKPPEPKKPSTGGIPDLAAEIKSVRIIDARVMLPRDLAPRRVDLGAARDVAPPARFFVVDLSLRARVGRAAKLEDREVDADLRLSAHGLEREKPLVITLAAKGPIKRAKVALGLALGSLGRVALSGTGGFAGGRPSYDLALDVANVGARALASPQLLAFGGEAALRAAARRAQKDVAAAVVAKLAEVRPLLPPSLSLRLRARGDGIPMQKGGVATVTLDVKPLRAAGAALDALHVDTRLRGKRFEHAKVRLRGQGVTLGVDAKGTLDALTAHVALRVAQLARLPVPGVKLRGSARLDADVSGDPKGKLDGKVDLRLRNAGVAGNAAAGLRLRAKLTDVARAPHGTLALDAHGLRLGGKPAPVTKVRLRLDRKRRGRPALLVLSAQGSELSADIAAAVKVPAKIADIKLERLALTLTKLNARQGGRRVSLAKPITLRYDPKRPIVLPPTTLGVFGGTVRVAARLAPLARGLRGKASVRLRGVSAFGSPRVSGDIDATVGWRSAEVAAKLTLDGGRTGRASIDAKLPLRRLRGRPAPLPGRTITRASVRVRRLALARLRRLLPRGVARTLGGTVDVSLDARGVLKNPALDVKVALRDIRVEKLSKIGVALEAHVGGGRSALDVRVAHASRPLVHFAAKAGGDLAQLTRGMPALSNLPLEASLTVLPIELVRLAQVHPALAMFRKADRPLRGVVKLGLRVQGSLARPRAKLAARLGSAKAANANLGAVELELDAEGGASDTRLRIRVGLVGERQLAISGDIGAAALALGRRWKTAPLKLNAALPRVLLSHLKRFSPALKGLRGKLDLSASVGGTALKPVARATVAVVDAGYGKVDIGTLGITASHRKSVGSRAHIELRRRAGGRLVGDVRIDPRQRLAARLTARRLRLAVVEKVTDAVRELDGWLDLDVAASGKLSRPRVTGNLKLVAKRLRLVGMSPLQDIHARLRFDPSKLVLERLAVRSGGTLEITGRVDLDKKLKPTNVLVKTRAKKLVLGAGPVQGAIYSGDVTIRGRRDAASNKILASVVVGETALKLPDDIAGSRSLLATGKLADVQYVDPAALAAQAKADALAKKKAGKGKGIGIALGKIKRRAPPQGLSFDIRTTADPIFVRAKQADVEVAAKVRTRIDSDGTTRLGGHVEIRRGHLELFDTRYTVQNARVSFHDQKKINPSLNVLLSADISSYRVLIGVEGDAKKPRLVLRSQPALEKAQVISLILTGRLAGRRDGSAGSTENAIASAAAQALVGGVLGKLGSAIGVDLRVSIDDLGQRKDSTFKAKLQAGRNITRRIYIGGRVIVGAPEGENVAEGIFEYRISARWLLTAVFGDKGLGGIDALWTYRY